MGLLALTENDSYSLTIPALKFMAELELLTEPEICIYCGSKNTYEHDKKNSISECYDCGKEFSTIKEQELFPCKYWNKVDFLWSEFNAAPEPYLTVRGNDMYELVSSMLRNWDIVTQIRQRRTNII